MKDNVIAVVWILEFGREIKVVRDCGEVVREDMMESRDDAAEKYVEEVLLFPG